MAVKTKLTRALGLTFAFLCGCVHPAEEFVDIEASQVPLGIRDTFNREYPSREILSAKKEFFQKKLVAYTVIFRERDSTRRAVTITPSGTVSPAVRW
jgi:hypothetical protein